MDDLYKNIRKKRKELNMSQQELAELVGYSGKSMISQVEHGLIDLPSTMITKIAEALNCTESYLMGWEKEIPPTVSGHTSETITTLNEDKTYDTEEVKKAMELWLNYEKADPNIRAAVETLLKPKQQDP